MNSKKPIISSIFQEDEWLENKDFDFSDITYHRSKDHGTVRIAINRPEVRNAFRPKTVDELYSALDHARMTTDVGSILLTGNGPSPKDGVVKSVNVEDGQPVEYGQTLVVID